MPVEVATAAVDRLLSEVEAGGKVNLASLGALDSRPGLRDFPQAEQGKSPNFESRRVNLPKMCTFY